LQRGHRVVERLVQRRNQGRRAQLVERRLRFVDGFLDRRQDCRDVDLGNELVERRVDGRADIDLSYFARQHTDRYLQRIGQVRASERILHVAAYVVQKTHRLVRRLTEIDSGQLFGEIVDRRLELLYEGRQFGDSVVRNAKQTFQFTLDLADREAIEEM